MIDLSDSNLMPGTGARARNVKLRHIYLIYYSPYCTLAWKNIADHASTSCIGTWSRYLFLNLSHLAFI